MPSAYCDSVMSLKCLKAFKMTLILISKGEKMNENAIRMD